MWGIARAAASALRALADLALPVFCASCAAPDERVCRACRSDVAACLWEGGPRRVRPDPMPRGLPPVTAAARYEGSLARLVAAYKDDGRRDVAPVLADLLALSLDVAVWSTPPAIDALARRNGPVLVVPVPSSRVARRRRGDSPLALLTERACDGLAPSELLVAPALRPRRRVADQAGLGALQRAANLEQSLRVDERWRPAVHGAVCIVVDDVVTTGATLVESARALYSSGAGCVVAATICSTRRRNPRAHRPAGAAPSGLSAPAG